MFLYVFIIMNTNYDYNIPGLIFRESYPIVLYYIYRIRSYIYILLNT